LEILFRALDAPVLNLGREIVFVSEVIPGFLQSLQESSGITSSFQYFDSLFPIHPIIRRQIMQECLLAETLSSKCQAEHSKFTVLLCENLYRDDLLTLE
jgi:hypothetical protein